MKQKLLQTEAELDCARLRSGTFLVAVSLLLDVRCIIHSDEGAAVFILEQRGTCSVLLNWLLDVGWGRERGRELRAGRGCDMKQFYTDFIKIKGHRWKELHTGRSLLWVSDHVFHLKCPWSRRLSPALPSALGVSSASSDEEFTASSWKRHSSGSWMWHCGISNNNLSEDRICKKTNMENCLKI